MQATIVQFLLVLALGFLLSILLVTSAHRLVDFLWWRDHH